MTTSRQDRVTAAWADAYRKISASVDVFCAKHGPPPNCLDMIREHAPAKAQEIEEKEKDADAHSVAWIGGGPGGVQAKIDAWVEAWLEALELVSLAR